MATRNVVLTELQIDAFRSAAQTGWDDLDAGRSVEVDDEDLDAYVVGLSPRTSTQ